MKFTITARLLAFRELVGMRRHALDFRRVAPDLGEFRSPPLPQSGCLGSARPEGSHSFDEGVDLRIGPNGHPTPVFVGWKPPSDSNIPMPHELAELLDRHAGV